MCFTMRRQAGDTSCSVFSSSGDIGGESELKIQESSQGTRERTVQCERNTLYNIQEGV
jgi:hypothetical protein